MANKKQKKIVYRSIANSISRLNEYRKPSSKLKWIPIVLLGIIVTIVLCFLPGVLVNFTPITETYAAIPSFALIFLILAGFVYSKKRTVRKFMKVSDVSDFVDYQDICNINEIMSYKDKRTWVFGTKREMMMPFFYNWFLSSGIIEEGTKLTVYSFPFMYLKERYELKDPGSISDTTTINLFCLDETKIKEDKLDVLSEEEKIVKPFNFSAWLELKCKPKSYSEYVEDEYEDDDDEYEDDDEAYDEDGEYEDEEDEMSSENAEVEEEKVSSENENAEADSSDKN